jgi:hypothetical protein
MVIEFICGPLRKWILAEVVAEFNSEKGELLSRQKLMGNGFAPKNCLDTIPYPIIDSICFKPLHDLIIDIDGDIATFKADISWTMVIVPANLESKCFHLVC